MKVINPNDCQHQSGFALVIVLSLVLLMSLLISIVFGHLHRERLNIEQLISRDGVFQDAEKRLHECSTAVDMLMPEISSMNCCLIEKSNPTSPDTYFRVSVHVIDSNPLTGSQSRQQQIIRLAIDPTSKLVKRELISWREILDPIWDQQIDQSIHHPWELITPCNWTKEKLL